jgi:peptidoglycan hydrolase-like protein with peptidoglycan-binding domain
MKTFVGGMALLAAGLFAAPVLAAGEHGAEPGYGQQGRQQSQSQVRQVQQKLNDMGYQAGPVDGIMGPQTKQALRSFQQAENLEQTGRLDQETSAALDLGEGGAATSGTRGGASGTREGSGAGARERGMEPGREGGQGMGHGSGAESE